MIEKSLAGPVGLFLKFSTLQDYGIDKVFFLENDNVDVSQKNIIFLARGENASQAIAVAGKYVLQLFIWVRASINNRKCSLIENTLPVDAKFLVGVIK